MCSVTVLCVCVCVCSVLQCGIPLGMKMNRERCVRECWGVSVYCYHGNWEIPVPPHTGLHLIPSLIVSPSSSNSLLSHAFSSHHFFPTSPCCPTFDIRHLKGTRRFLSSISQPPFAFTPSKLFSPKLLSVLSSATHPFFLIIYPLALLSLPSFSAALHSFLFIALPRSRHGIEESLIYSNKRNRKNPFISS